MDDILGMFKKWRSTVGVVDEDRSSALVAQAAQAKASVAPTVAACKALIDIAEADTDIYEAQGGAFKAQLTGSVRRMEVDADVAEATAVAQQRFVVSQERLSAVNATMQELTAKYSQTLAGGTQRAIGVSKQKQLPF
jgi:fructose-bisphosphate aldolase class 1